jgi:hypothetical protein
MTGLEIVVGFLASWAVRKARRVGMRFDVEVDQALDAGLDRLHEVVVGKLGEEPALVKLTTEVEQSGEASTRTQERVRLALEDAAETDSGFASDLAAVVQQLQDIQRQAGVAVAGQHGVAISGDVYADRGAVAIGGSWSTFCDAERAPSRPLQMICSCSAWTLRPIPTLRRIECPNNASGTTK